MCAACRPRAVWRVGRMGIGELFYTAIYYSYYTLYIFYTYFIPNTPNYTQVIEYAHGFGGDFFLSFPPNHPHFPHAPVIWENAVHFRLQHQLNALLWPRRHPLFPPTNCAHFLTRSIDKIPRSVTRFRRPQRPHFSP